MSIWTAIKEWALAPFADPIIQAREKRDKVWLPSGPSVDGNAGVRPQEWQLQAWRYWRSLGELHFPTSDIARMVSRVAWDVTLDGRKLTRESSDKWIEEACRGIGPSELARMVALNLQVAGEGWALEAPGGDIAFFSVTTPKLSASVAATRKAGRTVLRIWQPDPEQPDRADSSVRTVLGAAEELLTYEQLASAQSRSRIAQAGILLVPSEAKFASGDPFGRDLERTMMAPIRDARHPAATVPIKVEMAERLIEKVKHVSFKRPYDDQLPNKVRLAQSRIAMGLDIQPEHLTGMGQMTHWIAWLTQELTWKSIIEPLADQVADLMAELIRRLTVKAGTERRVEVTPDPSELLARRSTVRDALDAARLGAVGMAYVRKAIGATEDDKPTDEEVEALAGVGGRQRRGRVDENPGPPTTEPAVTAALAAQTLSGEIRGALAMAAATCRARVGARLRSRLSDCAAIDGQPNGDVVAIVGVGEAHTSIDLNVAVIEGLSGFVSWWDTRRPSELASGTAALLAGSWIAETIHLRACDLGDPPDHLISQLASALTSTHAA